MTRLFLAALPDGDTAARLGALRVVAETGVRPVPASDWHVTLRFLGEADVDDVVLAMQQARLPAARAVLGPAVERLDRRQIVVPVDGVDRLATIVRVATAGLGERDRHDFRGHLTLARTTPDAPSALIGRPVTAQFDVTHVALVRSDLRADGAVHTTVERFATAPLSG